ncbi:FadR/GntR family transcriptional regulator [Peribacillus butanolivorans]|uniref:FadR/GntR family transcriptional regulator n=1 Tax=Peribacillus butanolivorans TaxID=421767 RepID=UPI00364A2DDB
MFENKINQIKKSTLSQNIIQQIMQLIMDGSVSPGEKLPNERQLMELFGVGRSTLREAINALVAMGLIEVRVPEGTFVSESFSSFFTKHLRLMSKVSFNNIEELIEARIAYESDLAELAALKGTSKDFAELDNVLNRMMQEQDNEQFLLLDIEFHNLIARIARNSFMNEVLFILLDITKEWMHRVIQNYPVKDIAFDHHKKIAGAIKAKDPEKAREYMNEHLQEVSKILLSNL